MAFMDPVTLEGTLARLKPLGAQHALGLRGAVNDGRAWELWYTSAPAPDDVATDIAAKLELAAQRLVTPFATVRRSDEQVIGVTTFLQPLPTVPGVEIGSTWNAASARRTGTNTESKLLLMTHAFEEWGCRRVAFRSTWFNHESRRAIERLGAVFEGMIRNDRVLRTGEVTHTAQYSVTDDEWPAVRRHLRELLDRH